MKFFYVGITKNPFDTSEIHERNCPSIPSMAERSYLGPFNNGKEALRKAIQLKKNVAVCPECCGEKAPSISFFSHIGQEEN